MKPQSVPHFALWSAMSVIAVGAALTPLAFGRGASAWSWGLAGWFCTAVAGVGGGVWTVSRHGSPGAGFVLALGVCMLSRLILFVAGPFAAAPFGTEAVAACFVGLFAGYLPAQAAELIWFLRSGGLAGNRAMALQSVRSKG